MKKKLLVVISIVIAACFFLFVYGFISYDKYYFGDNSVFKHVESNGLIDEVNYTITKEKYTVTVDAFFCDQINTYVKLTVNSGGFSKNIDESIDDHIEYAVLTDIYGNSWEYHDELSGRVNNGDFALNETVIEFQGGPSEDCTVNLQIKLDFFDEPILFNNIKISVVEVYLRDFEEESYYICVPYAKGKITSIVYTPLKTQLLVDWEYDNLAEFCNSYINFVGNHSMKIITKSGEYEAMIFPHNSSGIPEINSKYNIYHRLNPNEELIVDLYMFDARESSMIFSKHLLNIPPVGESGKNE